MDMANEIKQLNAGKQESERKRKQADSQLQELTLRLAEIERSSGDQQSKVSKLQVRCFRCLSLLTIWKRSEIEVWKSHSCSAENILVTLLPNSFSAPARILYSVVKK